MEDPTSEIRSFLKECNELLSPTSDTNINPKIVGNYILNREDVVAQIIDWVLHYLEDRKCPYTLAIAIAKETAQQIENSIPEQKLEENAYDQEKALNSLMLYNETMRKLATVCQSFMENINEREFSTSLPYVASVFAIKNKRRKMEDRHVIHHDLNLLLDLKDVPPHSYYAVFDGHSGVDAASYASAHLHINIANHPAFLTDTSAAIAEAYKITDDNFFKKCQKQNLKSGTTAICALIREKTVYLSWVGDSQAVLVKDGRPLIVTSPHKPERLDEKERIENLGGCISFLGTWRVNGMLAVTRAIGDPDHKPYISSEPEITVIDLDGNEDFLILACDGLWDTMSPDDVISALYNNLSQSGLDEPVDAIAAKLVHQSKLQGSEDNITAVVVFLKDIKGIKEHASKYLPNVSETNFNSSNLGINGEKSFADMIPNYPITKPTELDLNATSNKKMKNAVNIPNASDFDDNSYGFSFSENITENSSYHSVNIENCSQNMFPLQQTVKSFSAPETTALSELPTPPIDDLAAEQFAANAEANSSCIPSSKIDSTSPERISDTSTFSEGLISAFDSENFAQKYISMEHISPTEAVDIASSVVSDTIETAVKCLSENTSETVMHVSTQKLNPYAEPFVMKSFVTEDTQSKTDVSDNFSSLSASSSNVDNSEILYVKSNLPSDIKTSQESNESDLNSEAVISANETTLVKDATDNQQILKENDQVTCMNLNIESQDVLDKSVEVLTESLNILEVKENLFTTSDISELVQVAEEPIPNLSMPNKITDTTLPISVPVQSCNPEVAPTKEQLNLDANLSDDIIEKPLSPKSSVQQTSENLILGSNKQEQVDEILSFEPLIENQGNLNIINILNSETHLNSPTDSINVKTQEIEHSELLVEITNTSSLSLVSASLEEILSADSTSVSQQSIQVHNENLESSNAPEVQNISNVTSETKNDTVSEPTIILDGISLPLTDMKESLLPTTAILPSEQLDDSHIEAVAVDLQTVPVGIPEAEGVTEDIDSDSEKDGGWSYMKGNIVGGTKHKTAAAPSTTGKPPSRSDTSKLKKETSSSGEVKSKVKTVGNLDKSKRLFPEKKVLDLKDKTKITKSTSIPPVKMTSEKLPRVAATTMKKEIQSTKVSTLTASKISKTTTTLRNTVSQSKSGSSLSSRNLTTTKPSLNSGMNFKPKSSSNEAKMNVAPTTSTPLSKKQPISQTTKSISSTTRTTVTTTSTFTRPISSTVPNRASTLSKSSSLQKPAPTESKSRPVSSLKRTVPSTLKKPDIKETKDIANKQILEKKTTIPKASSKISSVSSAANTLKPIASVSSKPVAKTLGSSLKHDTVKKDVPKTLNSRSTLKNQLSKDILKSKEKNALPVKNKFQKKSNLEVKLNENIVAETTPSEEEKFIREVNDKEVATKELIDIAANSVQEKIPTENGCGDENDTKQLEDMVVNTSESLL